MKKLMHLVAAAMFVIIVSCSGGSDPQSQLSKIDELLKKGFPVSAEQTENVNTLVAEGKRLMEEGKDKEASESLAEAIKILNLALDADIFNKAD